MKALLSASDSQRWVHSVEGGQDRCVVWGGGGGGVGQVRAK